MTREDHEIIRQIEDAAHGSQAIGASLIKDWMSCGSLEVKGAVAHFLRNQSQRITPPLSVNEICMAFENYYKDCLIQDIQGGDYAPSRYIAGYELANWFRTLWSDSAVPREYLLRIKSMLRELYLADERLRGAIVDAVLEHLFEIPEIAEFFADWKLDPKLNEGFERALDWTKKDPSKLRG